MSRGSGSHSLFVLGFKSVERRPPHAGRSGSDGYPPYDIERIPAADGAPERLRVTLAVAGFPAERLEIVEFVGQLVVRGRQKEDRAGEDAREHLHRGIAARQFQRVFLLGEAMRVSKALLERGLLSIELSPGMDARTGPDLAPAREGDMT
ncbi:Hsp20 family protein [Methylocella sp.]|uniref:Hsp20 family protein n=1 Tax=Methylocella sp. TaxID=1978226 RepID=UPI0035B31A0E